MKSSHPRFRIACALLLMICAASAQSQVSPTPAPRKKPHVETITITNIDGSHPVNIARDPKWDLEHQADAVIDYLIDGKMDIGVGEVDSEGAINPITFAPSELINYFNQQRHKDLIVIVFSKNMWSETERAKEVIKMKDYFLQRGYKRIVIRQGSGSPSFGMLLDFKAPPVHQRTKSGAAK